MTHKQRKWIQETKSKPLDLRGRAGQTFSSRNTSIKQEYDESSRLVTYDTTIQGKDTYTLKDRGHKGWRQETSDKKSIEVTEGVKLITSGYNGGLDIYIGPSPLRGTLSYRHSITLSLTSWKKGIRRHYSAQTGRVPESSPVPRRYWTCTTLAWYSTNRISSPPMEESTNTTAWTSSASAAPSMTSPSTVSTGFSSCYTRSFTKNNNISRDTGSSSVSRCLVKGCVKFCLNC